jgi:dTDP-glucose pyrophosphorylase
MTWRKHLIPEGTTIKTALGLLDELAQDALLFIVDSENRLIGSITDGDIRRGLMKGIFIEESVLTVANLKPKFLIQHSAEFLTQLIKFRENNFKIVPIVSDDKKLIDCINFRLKKTILPIECVIMAGGKGERLLPLTESIPKPLLKVGNKPIIEYNINAFKNHGISNCWISINYLGEQLEIYSKEKQTESFEIKIIREDYPMGTIGSIKLIQKFEKEIIMVCNSDLLNNVNLEAFYLDFINSDTDLSVVTIPYTLNIPYAVLELQNEYVTNLKEKPSFTYYSNGGIYLFKKRLLDLIPENCPFSATDFMEKIIEQKLKIKSFPHHGYWLDIGKHEDYKRANEDIKSFQFNL